MKCNYRFCQIELDPNVHGNRNYCDDECYMAEKLERAKDNYAETKKTLNVFKHVEKILGLAYKKYGSEPFSASVLRTENMNWSIMSGTTEFEGENFHVVGAYGYLVYNSNKVKIIKL